MKLDPNSIWNNIQAIKKKSPLIHNITNFVVMEKTANCLLAIGASPVMAHACEEVAEMTLLANSLVINIGTLSPLWLEGMLTALKAANSKGIPVVLDPVGAGATLYRTKAVKTILTQGSIKVIRGNASEITALQGFQAATKGVDSLLNSSESIDQAIELATKNHCIIWMSGETDVITDGQSTFLIDNGDPLMARVTGMGCTASSITGAFLAVNRNSLLATVHAAVLMGISGELSAMRAIGPGSFNVAFLDTLYNISLEEINNYIRVRKQ